MTSKVRGYRGTESDHRRMAAENYAYFAQAIRVAKAKANAGLCHDALEVLRRAAYIAGKASADMANFTPPAGAILDPRINRMHTALERVQSQVVKRCGIVARRSLGPKRGRSGRGSGSIRRHGVSWSPEDYERAYGPRRR